MDETLRRVGVLLDAQKKENNVSIPNGQGRRQQKGKDGEQKGSQTREEELLEFLVSLEELKKLNPEAFKSSMSHVHASSDGGQETDEIAIKQELSSLIEYLKAKANKESIDYHGDARNHIDIPGNANKPPPVPGIDITPIPGFTLKTVSLSNGSKVFINICSHEEIIEPSMKKRLNDMGEEIEGMNIPMSVGPPYSCKDKSGVSCIAYDVIVSPKVVESSKEDQTGQYKDFLCRLAIQSVEQKLKGKENFDQRYKLPKGLVYIGDDIHSQRIQDRKKMPSIEELEPNLVRDDREVLKTNSDTKNENELIARLFWEKENRSVSCALIEMKDDFTDYIEPLHIPANNVTALLVNADLDTTVDQILLLNEFDVKISIYKVTFKIPFFRTKTIYFPCAINVSKVSCKLKEIEGSVGKFQFSLRAKVERGDWDVDADPGSKNWLVRAAMRNDVNDSNNPYIDIRSASIECYPRNTKNDSDIIDDEELPEYRFQLNMPQNINKYSGLQDGEDNYIPDGPLKSQKLKERDDSIEFAEDKFHRRDANSQYIIYQREQAIKDKWIKHEKEKREKIDDPNVEYIDVEDFKPGGKYGPCGSDSLLAGTNRKENYTRFGVLQQASNLVREGTESDKDFASTYLESDLWSQLLD